jgi:hypothetical protein
MKRKFEAPAPQLGRAAMAEPPPPSKREEAARRAEEIEGIDKRGVEMWLVKVPAYLMEEWERLKQ